MSDATPKSADPARAVLIVVLIGAVLIAIIGTFVPDLAGFEGPEAMWIRLVFYVVAGVDILIAFWLRARLRKAKQDANQGGTVRRQ